MYESEGACLVRVPIGACNEESDVDRLVEALRAKRAAPELGPVHDELAGSSSRSPEGGRRRNVSAVS